MSKLLQFLFGKSPQIFNRKGRVEHDIGKTRWNQWTERFNKPEYDFKQHKGRDAKDTNPSKH